MNNRFYLTTPIYYPNGEPHIGHVYTTIAADTIARYHRLDGRRHLLPHRHRRAWHQDGENRRRAEDRAAALADRSRRRVFEEVWKELNITNDDFIRTTQPRHKQAVQKIVEKLLANGDIYLGSYEGWYDEGQEEFVTETDAKDERLSNPPSAASRWCATRSRATSSG